VRFTACLDMSHCGSVHPFIDAGVVADSVTGIHNAMVKCSIIVNRGCIHKKSTGFKSGKRGDHAGDPPLMPVLLATTSLLKLHFVMHHLSPLSFLCYAVTVFTPIELFCGHH
jgi:hypothetical protein